MTEITRLKQTKQGRIALFSHDDFLFSVSVETLADFGIEEGSCLHEGELSSLKAAGDTAKAKAAALRLLSRRAHSEAELREKLARRYDEDTCAAAAAQLRELGLLDDAAFACQRAEALAEKGKSRREIAMRLNALGVERALVQQALENLEADELTAATAVVRKSYLPRLAAGQRQQVMAALARRGFDHGTIVAALEAAGEAEE
ncbi:MAG: regulatory protein RecX [Oscillospiraceae bacterium]